LKLRAQQRSADDKKGELKSEGHDWLQQKENEQKLQYKTKINNAAENIKKEEEIKKQKLLKPISSADKSKWILKQKKNYRKFVKRI